MNSMTSSKSRTVVLAASLLILPSVLAAHHLGDDNGSDPELVVFGDSLADGGNYFVQTGEHTMRPFEFVPSAPYAIGGFHFSNGRTWVEQLARKLHDRKSGKPSLRVPGRFTNYAYGRARSRPGAATFPDFDLGTQVGLFLTDFGGIAPSGSTYVIGTGSNVWIRATTPTSPWLDRIINNPEVELRRGEVLTTYKATPLAHRRSRVNAYMAERYGWAEWLLAQVEDRSMAVPIYLDPYG